MSNIITSIQNLEPQSNPSQDYLNILQSLGISEIKSIDYYNKIGISNLHQGWMFHIPVWDNHFRLLLEKLIPYLITSNLSFLIPLDIYIHQSLQSGAFGYRNLGKIITIFPNETSELAIIAKDLIHLTTGYKGTPVPTDFHLGNIVYTRYGTYTPHTSQNENFITDDKGTLLVDDEPIPPNIFSWAPWPFHEITKPMIAGDNKILNNKYLIKKIIKPDVKGRVMTALYQKSLLNFKTCLIKEAIKGMGVDDTGRDITERLDWQLLLFRQLSPLIPMAPIIDNFEDHYGKYLAFEYIKGKSLGEYLIELYQGRSWYDLDMNEKSTILNILIVIVENIQKIHKAGFVHRDLNAENFFIDKNSKIWLLDFELAYDLNNNTPLPPYEKGTEGYMAPEQVQVSIPKTEQDIYSIGALLMISTMHISPEKFNTENKNILKTQISFFNNDIEIINLISSCLDYNERQRPTTNTIIKTIKYLTRKIDSPQTPNIQFKLNKKDLEHLLSKALHTLTYTSMLNSQGYWSSPISTTDTFIGNSRLDRTIYTGFRKGISGVLYAIGQAAIVSLQTDSIQSSILVNYDLICSIIQSEEYPIKPGLFKESYGMAMALYSLMKSELIPTDEYNLKLIKLCLSPSPNTIDIADGFSGYGLTLINCKDYLPKDFLFERLQLCLKTIINKQLSNGSWYFDVEGAKPEIITGFANGIAGITWFLLSYAETFQNDDVKRCAIKGLSYLLKRMKKINNSYVWPLAASTKELHDFSNGGFHILLPFIKAYKITKNELYKEVSEKVLNSYPEHLVSNMFSLERGVAGLGEVYLEAWQAFGNDKWLKRAEWLAGSLINTSYNKDEYSYWLLNDPFHPHADLLTGHCGIVHFLLRILRPDNISSIY